MITSRASGLILHPTSLPGPFGIGDLGPEAYKFADFLFDTNQSFWQMLPLGPIGYGNSPYMCFSAFAGNPLLISPEKLVEQGLLDSVDIQRLPFFREDRVDYQAAGNYKTQVLKKAFQKFKANTQSYPDDYYAFLAQNASWLEDYAFYMSLKEKHDNCMWTDWEPGLVHREPRVLEEWKERLSENTQFHVFTQYLFFRQWDSLKRYCNSRDIRVIGDMPIYVAHDSADVWINSELFSLDSKGNLLFTSGVPPDYFSITGQRWGNPVYRWDLMAKDGYKWWLDRFKLNFRLFDLLRLDHFRGFEAYWEIPADQPTAVIGKWVKAPGSALFRALKASAGDIPVIAEDLGVITSQVEELRDEFGFPGMKILQVAFGNDPKSLDYRPHNYSRHCVVYTASHDHNTTVGWFTAEPGTQTTQSHEEIRMERACVLNYLGTDGREINWDFIRLAMGSVATLAIAPLQDVLGLGTSARMNLPGTAGGNWEWRLSPGMLTPWRISRLKEMTTIYQRNPTR
jgi:4-alpha-glucanotransferase